MQDCAAEINLNEDLVQSRRWLQLKVIVLQEEQAAPRRPPPFDGQLLLSQDRPRPRYSPPPTHGSRLIQLPISHFSTSIINQFNESFIEY